MIAARNKRLNVTVDKRYYDYLEKIVNMYNSQVPESFVKQIYNIKKLSVSALYQMAIEHLMVNIDNVLDTDKTWAENSKNVFKLLCPSAEYRKQL